MSEMIERVARALCEADGCKPDDLEPGDALGIDGHTRNGDPAHFLWRQWSGKARAAIKAMGGEPHIATGRTTFGPQFFEDVGVDPDKWVSALRVRLGADIPSDEVLRDFFDAALSNSQP